MLPPYRAVLFDFDGVIAHTAPIIQQALWKFFLERKIKVAESEYERDGWANKSLAQVSVILKEKHGIELSSDEIRANIWETQRACFEAGIESDPTLIPFLEYCRHSGIPVAIGSNSIADRVAWVIKRMKIDSYFLQDAEHPESWYRILGATDIVHHKPDPEVWVRCAEMLNVPIEACLVIEDGLPGLTGARECGAPSIYYHHFCTPEKACSDLAVKSVKSFGELLHE